MIRCGHCVGFLSVQTKNATLLSRACSTARTSAWVPSGARVAAGSSLTGRVS